MKFNVKVALKKNMTLTVPLTDNNVFIVCPDCSEELSFPLESYLKKHILQQTDEMEPDSDTNEAMEMIDVIADTLMEIHEILTQADDADEHQ